MTGLELTFTALAILAFGATAWIVGVMAWRLFKSPNK